MPLFPGAKEKPLRRITDRMPDKVPPLVKSKAERSHERKRRQRELTIAGVIFAIMLILIFIQLQYIGSGSVIFFALFNFNAILLLGILFVVLRNGLKMLMERKRRIIGSRLRTRLVVAISLTTLIPCLVMFLVSAQFVKLSVDFWFRNQIESSMDAATELAGGLLESASDRLQAQGQATMEEINRRRLVLGGTGMDIYLARNTSELALSIIGYLDSDKYERNWHPGGRIGNSWQSVKETADWTAIDLDGYKYYISQAAHSDFMYGILALDGGKNGYLVLAKDMGYGFQARLDRIVQGSDEYKQLRSLKSYLKSMLYLTLTVLTSLIMLSIIWFAFRVAREITAPILALVNGTEQLAKGEEYVHIEDSSSDELGILVDSFNSMASEIIENRQTLTETNALLAQQNLVLDQQRQYVQTVLDNTAAGVFSFDSHWVIITANKAACNILEKKFEDIIGKSLRDILSNKELRIVEEVASTLAIKPQSQLQRQLHHQTSDGRELSLLVIAAGLTSSDGQLSGAVAVFEDVTEMEKMQRMSAWREVARRIAHEIKNPLTPIKLSAQRLEKKYAAKVDDPVFTQSTQLIVRQVEQLQTMVQEFSTFAKLPEINIRHGKLDPILEDIFTMFQGSFPSIKWQLEMSTLPALEMDPDSMHRAFLNLFTNAAEALEKVNTPAVTVRAAYNHKRKQIRVDIEDNGPELLNDEERARLFEPYFSRKKGGTGLGLTIVRSIITAHRGYVRFVPGESGGSCVTVELPVE